jgi:predicted PurR-regulated permease PerM
MDVRLPDNPGAGPLLLRRALSALIFGALAFLCVLVMRPFLSPALWAVILAYVTWPLYRRLRIPFRDYGNAAASLMTLLVAAVAITPVFWLLILIQRELVDVYQSFTAYLAQGPHALPLVVQQIPWLGASLQDALNRYSSDSAALGHDMVDALRGLRSQLGPLVGGIGRNLGKLLVTLLTLFFFYRDGDSLVRQVRRVANRLFDDRLGRFVHDAELMTRAVVYGTIITALAQGVIAGIGYWIFGLEAPAVLGALTGLLSAAPLLGTAFIWAPLGVGLVLDGHTLKGILLLAWGLVFVHPTDNVLRPLMISSVTRVPFLLVMFGALGGLAAFGLVGLFVGPVLLGIASSVWREWATEREPVDL